MSISSISQSTLAATYAQPVQQFQQAKAPLKSQAPTDTVTISPQALKLASDGDSQAQEVRETGAEKASEASRGKD